MQLDIQSAEEACLAARHALRSLDAKLQKELPVEPGPYELPVAAAADLKAFLNSSVLVEEEKRTVQESPAPSPTPPPDVPGGFVHEAKEFERQLAKRSAPPLLMTASPTAIRLCNFSGKLAPD
jgi:hypothetical protein